VTPGGATSRPAPGVSGAAPGCYRAPVGAKGHLLIVEDDASIRESLSEFLEAEGFQVSTARDGSEGLDRLSGASPLPSLVILDLHMPVLDGEQFLARLRSDERLRALPVLLMSGNGSHRGSPALPVDAVLPKPFEIEELLAAVERLGASGSR